MPTYEYRCPEGHTFEKFQKISDPAEAQCPECGAEAERMISGGAGLVFKGSGFYITDYGKDGKGPRKPQQGAEAAGPKKEGAGKEKASGGEKTSTKPKPTGE